jgi:hypothetical protein
LSGGTGGDATKLIGRFAERSTVRLQVFATVALKSRKTGATWAIATL